MGIRQDPQTLEKESERKSRREREGGVWSVGREGEVRVEKGGESVKVTKNIFRENL